MSEQQAIPAPAPGSAHVATTLRQCCDLVARVTLWQAAGLGVLVLIGTALDALGIGLIFPFIQLVADPSKIHQFEWARPLLGAVPPGGERTALAWIAGGLILLFALKNALLFAVNYVQSQFITRNERILAERLLGLYIDGAYVLHLQRNSSEFIFNVLTAVTSLFGGTVLSAITVATELLLVVTLAVVLAVVNPLVTALAVLVLGVGGAAFYRFLKRMYAELGREEVESHTGTIRSLQQGLHSIKEVKVLGCERFVVEDFARSYRKLSRTHAIGRTLNNVPRLYVETLLATGMLSAIIVVLSTGTDSAQILAILTLFGAAALRIIPSMNRILMSLTRIKNTQHVVSALHADFTLFQANADEASEDQGKVLPLTREIRLQDVWFTYPGERNMTALRGADIVIRKGESIGLVGSSGAGKTTLVDVVLGLLRPTRGEVLVDGVPIASALRSWRRQTGYVPQLVNLSDETVRRNVAFGVRDAEIDDDRVWHALRLARLEQTVREMPHGLDTLVGERGTRLSGGQRQRLGIARALYRDPEVLVFDEATSALDNETEREIQQAIDAFAGAKTIIVIAHRLSTVRRCDKLVMLSAGRIIAIGSYDQLVAESADFRRLANIEAA